MKTIASLVSGSDLTSTRPNRVRTSPYDLGFYREISDADSATISQAVFSARRFAAKNFGISPPDFGAIEALTKLNQRLRQKRDWLSEVEARWTSRSWTELYRDSIPKAVETIEWFCANAQTAFDAVSRFPAIAGVEYRVDPIGVVAAITPWNDPLVAFSWKVVPPLIAGNCVIWKPSENCLETAHWIVRTMLELGLPKEKLQLIVGDGETGSILVNSQIDGIAFTGSTQTAKLLASSAYERNLVKLHIEAGGKGCALLDLGSATAADMDLAVEDLCRATFFNQGQICSAPTVLFVKENQVDSVVNAFRRKAKIYAPGNPLDKNQTTGGLISKEKREELQHLLSDGLEGKKITLTRTSDGLHGLDPTLVVFPDKNSKFVTDELFGPVLTLQPYDSPEEFIDFLNESKYGLANGVYTKNKDIIEMFKRRASGGILHVNSWGRDPVGIPFGGIRNSGFGKEKCIDTILHFTNIKPVCQL